MKTKEKDQNKDFDPVNFFCEIKYNISEGLSFKEIKEYLKRESAKQQAE